MEDFNKESRFWAIAINAVREAKINVGRADDPFSDDDSARVTSIFDLLHVYDVMTPEREHYPLVKKEKISEKVAKVANTLKELPEELRQSEARVSLPGQPVKAA